MHKQFGNLSNFRRPLARVNSCIGKSTGNHLAIVSEEFPTPADTVSWRSADNQVLVHAVADLQAAASQFSFQG
jgi:hypothetical protein